MTFRGFFQVMNHQHIYLKLKSENKKVSKKPQKESKLFFEIRFIFGTFKLFLLKRANDIEKIKWPSSHELIGPKMSAELLDTL